MRTLPLRTASLFIAILFFTTASRAQTDQKQFEQAITNEFCDSFSKVIPRLTKETWTGEVGMLIVPLLNKYGDQIENYWKLNISNTKDCGAIGEKIGQLATFHCASFQDYLRKNMSVVDEVVSEKTSGIKSFSGKLLRVEGRPFAYLVAQNSEGKTEKFYWLGFFPGAGQLTSSETSLLQKPVLISFKEMEVYHPAEKEYRIIKVITALGH